MKDNRTRKSKAVQNTNYFYIRDYRGTWKIPAIMLWSQALGLLGNSDDNVLFNARGLYIPRVWWAKKIWDQPIFLQGIERRNLTSQPQRYWWRLVNGGLVLLLKKEQMEWAGVFFLVVVVIFQNRVNSIGVEKLYRLSLNHKKELCNFL